EAGRSLRQDRRADPYESPQARHVVHDPAFARHLAQLGALAAEIGKRVPQRAPCGDVDDSLDSAGSGHAPPWMGSDCSWSRYAPSIVRYIKFSLWRRESI